MLFSGDAILITSGGRLKTGPRESLSSTTDTSVSKDVQTNDTLKSAPRVCSKCVAPIRQDESCHLLSRSWAFWEKTASAPQKTIAGDTTCGDKPMSPYSSLLSRVKSFNSIESFMPVFNGIPPASAIVNENHIYRQIKLPFEATTGKESSSGEQPESSDSTRAPADTPKSYGIATSTGSILDRKPLPGEFARPAKQLDTVMFFEDGVKPDWNDQAHFNGGILEFTFKSNFPGRLLDKIWETLLFSVLGNTIPNCSLITGVRMVDRLPQQLSTSGVIVCVRLEVWHREMTQEMKAQLRINIVELLTGPDRFSGGSVVAERAIRKGKYVIKTPINLVEIGQNVEKSVGRRKSA